MSASLFNDLGILDANTQQYKKLMYYVITKLGSDLYDYYTYFKTIGDKDHAYGKYLDDVRTKIFDLRSTMVIHTSDPLPQEFYIKADICLKELYTSMVFFLATLPEEYKPWIGNVNINKNVGGNIQPYFNDLVGLHYRIKENLKNNN